MDDNLPNYFSDKELSDLGIEIAPALSEEELLSLIARRVAEIMQQSTEAFFQIMYRMDIPEAALSQAMSSDNPEMSIAEVILKRQKMKLKARAEYRQASPDNQDDDLRW